VPHLGWAGTPEGRAGGPWPGTVKSPSVPPPTSVGIFPGSGNCPVHGTSLGLFPAPILGCCNHILSQVAGACWGS
jgi:hypothetical protein